MRIVIPTAYFQKKSINIHKPHQGRQPQMASVAEEYLPRQRGVPGRLQALQGSSAGDYEPWIQWNGIERRSKKLGGLQS